MSTIDDIIRSIKDMDDTRPKKKKDILGKAANWVREHEDDLRTVAPYGGAYRFRNY